MGRRTRSDPSSVDVGNSDNQDADGRNHSIDGGSDIETAAGGGSDGSSSVVDPGSVGGNSDSKPGRKPRSDRGKPRGSRADKAEDKINLGDFAQIISEIHSGIALLANIPELALDESKDEHIKLARAIERVKRHYDLPSVSPIALDWFLLLKAVFMIYGARLIAYNLRTRAENARPINNPPAVMRQAPINPTAPPPAQPTPKPPPNAPINIQPAPGVIRAATIPGFEGVTIDVPVGGSTKQH